MIDQVFRPRDQTDDDNWFDAEGQNARWRDLVETFAPSDMFTSFRSLDGVRDFAHVAEESAAKVLPMRLLETAKTHTS